MKLIEMGSSKNLDFLFRSLDDEEKLGIKNYIDNLDDDYVEFKNDLEIDFSNSNFSSEDISYLKDYSGYIYQYINDDLNGRWSYDYDGDEKFRLRCQDLANEINRILLTNAGFSSTNFKTFRGVNISSFNEYEIYELKDLNSLKGKFLFDSGFISTSFLREKSYFKKEVPDGLFRNVLIEYNVPKDFREMVYLDGEKFTYSTGQRECLLNSDTLSYVNDVIINDDETAIVKVSLIPKIIYRKDYRNILISEKSK